MKSELSYLSVAIKALLIDIIVSVIISIFLIANSFTDYISNKCFILPIISALATVFLSNGLVYKERNHGVTDKLITSIVLLITCIFCLMAIIVSMNDIKQISGIIIFKIPLSSVAARFLPNNYVQIKKKEVNKKKLDPKKKITDNIYYY